jgi:hypothetical protein
MPSLPPISSGRLIFAQQAEIRANKVPPVLSLGIQRPRTMTAEEIPQIVDTFQTPKRSARNPQATRPKKAPVWRMAIEYDGRGAGRLLADARVGAKKKGVKRLVGYQREWKQELT